MSMAVVTQEQWVVEGDLQSNALWLCAQCSSVCLACLCCLRNLQPQWCEPCMLQHGVQLTGAQFPQTTLDATETINNLRTTSQPCMAQLTLLPATLYDESMNLHQVVHI